MATVVFQWQELNVMTVLEQKEIEVIMVGRQTMMSVKLGIFGMKEIKKNNMNHIEKCLLELGVINGYKCMVVNHIENADKRNQKESYGILYHKTEKDYTYIPLENIIAQNHKQ